MSRWIVVLFLSLLLPWAAYAVPDPAPGAAASAGELADAADVRADTDNTSTDPDVFAAARDSLVDSPAGAAPPRFRAAQLAPPYLEVLGRPPRAAARIC